MNTRVRISVVACFIQNNHLLVLHQTTPPEPNCWDLPGGGIEPEETLFQALRREVEEETGLEDFIIEGLLTICEGFYLESGGQLHAINIIYTCTTPSPFPPLSSQDPEIGERGICWLPIKTIDQLHCSTRTWAALKALNFVS
ncbi:MAG: NUDIX hydrolase [Cyanobacteria bacterium WB6_1B_304]|nr:NUDIX hydrolase [Cyanobacteria bacterium WB6_1B_304]